MSDNYGRGGNPPDGGYPPPPQQPPDGNYQQPPQQPPYQQPYQQPPYQPPPPQPPYQQQPYQQPPYQQPPGYTPPPVTTQSSTVVTTGGGGAPILPIIIGVLIVAALAVGAYFLFLNKSSTTITTNQTTPTAVANNPSGANTPVSPSAINTPSAANTPTTANIPSAVNTPGAANTPAGNSGNGGILGGLMVQVNGKSADTLLPKETLAYLSFNAKPGGDQQANLNRIGDAFTSQPGWAPLAQQFQSLSKGTTQNTTQQCSSQTGGSGTNGNGFITNATDVLQGNVLLAFLTPNVQQMQQLQLKGANSSCAALAFFNQGFVVIADTSVSQGSLLGKLKDTSGSATKVETYNGQDITKFDSNGSTYYLTMFGSTAVLAANEDNIKKVVDTGKGSDSLGADQQYQGAASHLPANRLGSLYVNVTEVAALAQAMMQQQGQSGSSTPIPANVMDLLKNLKGVAMVSFTAQPNGLQMDISTNIDLGSIAGSYVAPKLDPRAFLDKIPADAWLVYGSQDLPGIYKSIVDQINKQGGLLGGDPTTLNQQLTQFKQQLNTVTGMDFDTELLPLLNGEVSLYVSPDTSGGALPVGSALVIKTSDATKAATLAQNIAARMSAAGGQSSGAIAPSSDITPTEGSAPAPVATSGAGGAARQAQDINGGKFYLVNVSGQQVYIGTIDDLLFISYGKGAIDNWGKSAVSSSDVFKHSTDTTEKPNSTLLYINLKAIAQFAEQMIATNASSKQMVNQYKPLFAPLEGMAITGVQYDQNSGHVVIFIDIQKP